VSGQTFHRPQGQRLPPGAAQPVVGPSKRLDYELELGVFIGGGNSRGTPIPMADAEAHIFGMCLLNDWSARDLQAWEYQPLGPFLAKNFATTISPWIVTLQALAPFRVPYVRPEGAAAPLPYLNSSSNRDAGAIDIRLDALIHSAAMLGTGTQSGPTPGEAGSLLELSVGGSQPIQIGRDEYRTFLEDGDTVIFRGWCESPAAVRIGFGDARGRVLPAIDMGNNAAV
jgi:fumarylacetoacetase